MVLDHIVPTDTVWTVHLSASIGLTAVAAAYVTYMVRSALARRIALDRLRLAGLLGNRQARLGALNVILYWVFFAALLSLIVTGAMLHLGNGGAVVGWHRLGALTVALYAPVHVFAQYLVGGGDQLMRVFRPRPLAPPPPPFDPAEVIIAARSDFFGQEQEKNAAPDRSRWRSWRPMAAAAVAGLIGGASLLAMDRSTRDVLAFARIDAGEAPVLDGDLSDAAWLAATPVTVETNQGAYFDDGSGATAVEIRALHDHERAYLAFVWSDPTRSLKHLPLVKTGEGWRILHEDYDIADEDLYFEDRFAVVLSRVGTPPGDRSFHFGAKPLEDRPAPLSGRGLHYTLDGSYVDLWQWRASHGGAIGYAEDCHIGPPAKPDPAQIAGERRYAGGFAPDPGKAAFIDNFDEQGPGGYGRPVRPKRLPRDLTAVSLALGAFELAPEQSDSAEARWWMSDAESVAYSETRDRDIPVGAVIPGVLSVGVPEGDRADVRAAARWAAGRWTLEVSRALSLRSAYDLDLETGVFLWVSAFDHTQTRHTRHDRPLRLELEP